MVLYIYIYIYIYNILILKIIIFICICEKKIWESYPSHILNKASTLWENFHHLSWCQIHSFLFGSIVGD